MAELWQSCGRVDKRGNRSLKYTVLTENIIEEEQGVVLDVLQKGYMYKDKLLRPAMVKVNE